MKYYVYILKSINHEKTYVGFTENIERRIKEHNQGKSKYTSKFKPWQIAYYEEVNELEEAIRLEKYYKRSAVRRKIKKLLSPGSSAG